MKPRRLMIVEVKKKRDESKILMLININISIVSEVLVILIEK